MFYTDAEILARCPIPDDLPINSSVEDYRAKVIGQVRRDMRRGASLSEATAKLSTNVKPSGGRKRGRLATMAMVGAMALGATAAAVGGHIYTPDQVSAITTSAPGKIAPISGIETVLVVGEDSRESGIGGNSDDIPGSRTDMIALVSISSDPAQALVVSFPRDLKVDRPTCTSYDSDTGEYGRDKATNESGVKINSVYEVGGPACLTKTVEDLTDVKINKYVQVDFSSFQRVVDNVGGVNIHSDGPIHDEILGTIIEAPGVHRLDGGKALDYVRARHVLGTAMNDFERVDRQQEFLFSLMESVREARVMDNPVSALKFAGDISSGLTMDGVSIPSGVSMMKTIMDLPPESIHTATAPIDGEDEYGNLILDKARAIKLFSVMTSGKPIMGTPQGELIDEIPADVETSLASPMKIVFNDRTYEDAVRIGEKLSAEGLQTELLRDDTANPMKSKLIFSENNADEAASVGAVLPQVELSPGVGFALILGDDSRALSVNRVASSGPVQLPKGDARAADIIPVDIRPLSGPTQTGIIGGN